MRGQGREDVRPEPGLLAVRERAADPAADNEVDAGSDQQIGGDEKTERNFMPKDELEWDGFAMPRMSRPSTSNTNVHSSEIQLPKVEADAEEGEREREAETSRDGEDENPRRGWPSRTPRRSKYYGDWLAAVNRVRQRRASNQSGMETPPSPLPSPRLPQTGNVEDMEEWLENPTEEMKTEGNGGSDSDSEDDEDMGLRNLWEQTRDDRSTTDAGDSAHEDGNENDDDGEEDWEVERNEWYETMERVEGALEGDHEHEGDIEEVDGRLLPAARPRVVGVTVTVTIHLEDGDDTLGRH